MTTMGANSSKKYGFTIDRSGAVYRLNEPARRGRPVGQLTYLGQVYKVPGKRVWRNDACATTFNRQQDAAHSLNRIIPTSEEAAACESCGKPSSDLSADTRQCYVCRNS